MGVKLLAGRVWEAPHRLGRPQLPLRVFQPVLHVFDLAMETLGLQHSPAESHNNGLSLHCGRREGEEQRSSELSASGFQQRVLEGEGSVWDQGC